MSTILKRQQLCENKLGTQRVVENNYIHTKTIHSTRWAVGMTVAYRRVPTVKATVDSLAAAGWRDPYLYCEPNSNDLPNGIITLYNTEILGNWGNFCRRLKHMVRMKVDKFLLVQDDVELLPNTREWLEDHWPCNEGVVSLYRSARYDSHEETERPNSVYDTLVYGRPFLGMLAVAMSREHAESLTLNLDAMANHNPQQDDMKFGDYVHALRIPVNLVIKSRCQHIGRTSSIYKNTNTISTLRQADSYEK